MIRRPIAVSAIAVLTLGLVPAATAAPGQPAPDRQSQLKPAEASESRALDKGPVLSLGKGSDLYLVQLDDAAVPTYDGGVEGLAPVQAEGREFAPEGAREEAYRDYVVSEQADLRRDVADVTGSRPQVAFTYTDALNGIALELTRAEARQVAELDGVAAVQVDEERRLQTDVGPEWIGAPSIWDGSATPSGTGTKGEGVVAGILDSGINAANPSFHDAVSEADGGDGYDHDNPKGKFFGTCDPANTAIYNPDFECNDKLIGAWDFAPGDNTGPDGVGYAYDEDGHGTHTASTTAGNQVDATTYAAKGTPEEFSTTENIKGVAPHANVIAYDVCAGGCPLTAIIAGIEQAIDDGVDVINYSIGSAAASNPWSDPDALGFLNARAAGIDVATSAGNAGPGAATVGSPADVPWITSVGATQHNRQWQASVQDLAADGGATLPDIQGLAFASATDGAFDLVYAGAAPYDNAKCGIEGGTEGDGTFPAGTDLTGKIIVCDRGGGGRVEKGTNVRSLGAEGMILANDEASGDSLNADPHDLPAVHITYDDGVALKQWMTEVTGEQASLSGGQEFIGPEVADIMAGFSSRGPNRAVEMISPSLSAPGVDVLAGNGRDNEVSWGFISGTSMASPHVAGAMALVSDANPDWTPAEVQSALMTTAFTDVEDTDGSEADWFDMGSGRADLTKAADAGLVLDETKADYDAANPALGGDVKELNTASMASAQCLQQCSWTRTVEATETGGGTWTAEGSAVTDGIQVTVEPATFSLEPGQTQEITVTADVAGTATDAYQFGNVVLTPAEGSQASPAHLPVAALPSTGVFQDEIEIDTRRDAGSQESEPIEAVEITDLQIQANGLVPADVEELAIPQDATNTNPYDGNGTKFVNVTVPQGATRLIANLTEATAPDFDLFVGKGETPSAATEVASSASGGSAESIDLPLEEGDAGTWWILVQNWEASSPTATDTVDLGSAVVAGDEGNLRAEGPQTQPELEPFTIRTFWDEPKTQAGQTWYGSLTLRSAPGGTEIGTIPVTVDRLQDDVTKTVDKDQAAPGETLTYTVEVQPNVTPEDLTYTFSDRLPEDTTYVEGSGPEGATVSNGVLTWEHTMPSPVGAEGDYAWSTSASDPSCRTPFGDGGYVDLAAFNIGPDPAVSGDDKLFSALEDRSFGYYEGTQSGLSFSDDGFLVFGDPGTNYAGAVGEPQQLPDEAAPNGVAAMLWQDMQIVHDAAAGSGVTVAVAGPGLGIIEYDDMRLASDAGATQGTFDFEVFGVTDSRDLVFAFDNVTGPLGEVTIGAENLTGDNGSALVNRGSAAGIVTDGTVVCGTYEAAQFDPETFTYQVTVDDTVMDGQVLRNELEHVTDDPGAEPVTVTSDVAAEVASVVTVEGTRDAEEPDTDGVFTLTRPDGSAAEALTVTYTVADRRARPGRDYVALDGEVTFGAGEATATEVVEIIDRRGRQPKQRTVEVTLQPGADYEVGDPASALLELVDRHPKDRRGRR